MSSPNNNTDETRQQAQGTLSGSVLAGALPACLFCETQAPPDQMVELPCGHSWCPRCLEYSVRGALLSRVTYPPMCCEDLPGGIPIFLVQGHLDQSLLAQWDEKHKEFSDPDPTYCSNPRCTTYISSLEIEEGARYVKCQKCGEQTCVWCGSVKDAHVNSGECPEGGLGEQDHEVLIKEGWIQCPRRKCGVIVERIDGCNHMICECGAEFCYACGGFLQGDHTITENGAVMCNCSGEGDEDDELSFSSSSSEAQDDDNKRDDDQPEGQPEDQSQAIKHRNTI